MIRKGQRVTIKLEYSNAGDELVQWIAIEDEHGGRVRIQAVNTGMTINPTQVVMVEWLDQKNKK